MTPFWGNLNANIFGYSIGGGVSRFMKCLESNSLRLIGLALKYKSIRVFFCDFINKKS